MSDSDGRPPATLHSTDRHRAAIIVVSDDPAVRESLDAELTKRYAADYDIVTTTSESLRPLATQMRAEGAPVALVLGGMGGADPDGIEVLAGVRRIHPTAVYVPTVRWGDWSTAQPIFEALTLGKIDHWVTRPEDAPDEEFHQAITDYLSDWSTRRGRGFEAVRVIGERWSPRSQELRDTFSRNGIPIGFYDAASATGRRMLADLGLDTPALPVVLLRFGATRNVLVNPSNLDIGEAFGLMTPIPPDEVFDVAVVGAGPAGPGGRRLRLVRGAQDRGRRAPGRRWTGRDELADPQLSRIPEGDKRQPARLQRLPAGVVVRHHVPGLSRCRGADRQRRGQPPPGVVRRLHHQCPDRGHHHRRGLPPVGRCQS